MHLCQLNRPALITLQPKWRLRLPRFIEKIAGFGPQTLAGEPYVFFMSIQRCHCTICDKSHLRKVNGVLVVSGDV